MSCRRMTLVRPGAGSRSRIPRAFSPARVHPVLNRMNLLTLLRTPLVALSWPLQRRLARLIYPPGTQAADFLQPPGEAALQRPGQPAKG